MDQGSFRFGRCTLNPRTRRLTRDGIPIALQQQPLEILLLFLERVGQVVTRDEIRQRVWPDAVVEYDQSINYAVRQVRLALCDDAVRLQTVSRRGYRFVGPVSIGSPMPRRSVAAATGLAAAFVAIFGAGIVAAHTDAGALIYEHIVHPNHCPYVRMMLAAF